MDETRAIARLAHLDIEIRHCWLPQEQAEQLVISLKTTPSFEQFAEFMERQAPWPWLALQPWLWLGQMVQASWQPWFAASSTLVSAPPQPAPAEDRQGVH